MNKRTIDKKIIAQDKRLNNITKEQLESILIKYAPSKFILFVDEYFPIKYSNKKHPIGTYASIIGFIIGSIGIIIADQSGSIHIASLFLLFYISFGVHIVLNLISYILNKKRIEKICEELFITTSEYNLLIDEFDI